MGQAIKKGGKYLDLEWRNLLKFQSATKIPNCKNNIAKHVNYIIKWMKRLDVSYQPKKEAHHKARWIE